jgi:predicted phage terminase large subunit-like protein
MALVLVKDMSALELWDAESARSDFDLFVRLAWHVLEPSTRFVPGRHLEAICEHLSYVASGDIKRLLVNMPPRHCKSSLINVLWPAWMWLQHPSVRFLCGSYALNLATRDNLKHRRIVKHPWFVQRYGHLFKLTKDQDAKMKFETDKGGYRMAVSVGSSATGEGGDILLLDDPHNIDEKESDVKRKSAIDWFDNTWSTRMNDQQTGAMIVVGQRIHQQDVSGHILEGNDGEWVHLNLPAEYEPGTACRTYFPSGKELWSDWRTQEGELLWEKRFPRPVIEKAKRTHGVLGYSAIYQQAPVPPGGYVFNRSYERLFSITPQGDTYVLHTPGGDKSVLLYACYLLTTSDVAIKEKEAADYTVFATWAVTPENDVLLLDVVRDHWTSPKQKEQARVAYRTWVCDRYRAIWFEDVGYQSAIGQDLLVEGIPCMEFRPTGDKVQRATGASIWQEAGKVYFLKGASWLEAWRSEIYTFPKDAHDDQVDTLSMVCMIVRTPEMGVLDHETVAAIASYRGY